MSDLAAVPTAELLTRAADAAGRHAELLARRQPKPSELALKAANREVQGAFFNEAAHRARIGDPASGPDHWRAVEAMLRTISTEHERYWRQHQEPEHRCRHGYIACHLAEAARPLAEQVLRDLGGS